MKLFRGWGRLPVFNGDVRHGAWWGEQRGGLVAQRLIEEAKSGLTEDSVDARGLDGAGEFQAAKGWEQRQVGKIHVLGAADVETIAAEAVERGFNGGVVGAIELVWNTAWRRDC